MGLQFVAGTVSSTVTQVTKVIQDPFINVGNIVRFPSNVQGNSSAQFVTANSAVEAEPEFEITAD